MKNLYCVYDKVAKEFADPFKQNNDDSACRAFLGWLKKDTQIHSEDYSLYLVGYFDSESGTITPDFKEIPIVEGDDV